jgi:NAD(P)-dependent dehydrogenase (short-subunit alcohol dehydrogenase family)
MGEYNTTIETEVTSFTPTYRSAFRPSLFDGQTIIVTGGGSGIGRCTAHELASLGARVVLVGRKLEKLEAVQAEISQAGGQCSFRQLDIRDEDGVAAMVKSVVSEFGRIHGLVNNAGGQYMTPLEDISLKGWQAVVNSNLTGGFLMARECFHQSMKANGGVIVNIVADFWYGAQRRGARRHGEFHRNRSIGMGPLRDSRECCCTGLHRLKRYGPLPARGGRQNSQKRLHRAARSNGKRGGDQRCHRLLT